jgi:hypothetical protein
VHFEGAMGVTVGVGVRIVWVGGMGVGVSMCGVMMVG